MGIYLKRYTQDKPPLGSQIDWSHPLAKGLVGCWLMNEGGGNITQDIARKNNGINTNTYWILGNKGKTLSFNGTTSVVNCGKKSSVSNMLTRTYSAWINPVSIGENSIGYILGKVGGVNAFSWNMVAVSTIGFTHTGTTTLQRTANDNLITLNSWQHVLMTWDGVLTTASSVHIYVNGTEVSYKTTTNGSGTINDAGGNLCIGNRDTDTARTFDGMISSVQIWNRILSSSEIRFLYQDPYCFIKTPKNRIYSYLTPAIVTGQPRSYGYLF